MVTDAYHALQFQRRHLTLNMSVFFSQQIGNMPCLILRSVLHSCKSAAACAVYLTTECIRSTHQSCILWSAQSDIQCFQTCMLMQAACHVQHAPRRCTYMHYVCVQVHVFRMISMHAHVDLDEHLQPCSRSLQQ